MIHLDLSRLGQQIRGLRIEHPVGRITAVNGGLLHIGGVQGEARIGDRVRVLRREAAPLDGEVLQLSADHAVILPESAPDGVSLGDRAILHEAGTISPADDWIGRVIDPFGAPLDGRPLLRGAHARPLRASPPAPATRHALGARLETGMAVFNTMLPLVEGQRLGLFAGSGVGKTTLLAHLARHVEADVIVIAMIGERGRELREFVDTVLGPEGMKRAVVVAATSDQSPLARRRCAWTAMTVAEHFRDQGCNVLFLGDSITRFAEAHREVAVASGELPSLRGYPPSTAHTIMSLCERAGPGAGHSGAITAVFTVLVAGSDMEEPIADILRGVLDGHVVLDRQIAERGRYPAIDLLRSVSRSLPDAASEEENKVIAEARHLLGVYARSEMMIRAGLYAEGSDPETDRAIRVWPLLDGFLAETESQGIANSFNRLRLMLRRAANASGGGVTRPAGTIGGPARRPDPGAATTTAGVTAAALPGVPGPPGAV